MSPAVLEAPSLFADAGFALARSRRPTLGERLDRAWAQVQEGADAECPACHARMTPRSGAGQCTGCGARLS